ncbi:hypothetical protein JYB64_08685 [Algoriphagus aestuarii]|nr:hypothetical protein [Algoriphagus aestuarii]
MRTSAEKQKPASQKEENTGSNNSAYSKNVAPFQNNSGALASQLKEMAGKSPLNPLVKPVQLKSEKVIQRAGHAEDLLILPDWIVKRTDAIEIGQYTSGQIPIGNAPNFQGPFYSKAALMIALGGLGINLSQAQDDKISEMEQTIAPNGKGYMLLSNATSGMVNPELRDLKLGKHSASGTDQERHGVTGFSKTFKIFRHDMMDKFSGSSDRGFRDEDRWKTSMLGDNLDELNQMLGVAGNQSLLLIRQDLQDLWAWINSSNVVYVGMSILVVSDPTSNTGKAVAIDFEHPIRSTDDSFATHQSGILEGIMNIKDIVNGHLQ